MTTARKTTRDLRIANTRSVLEIIHRDGPISAARLSERCALRPSTISNILKDVTARGAVRSCGLGDSTRQGGKRPLLLELDPRYGWLAGAEIDDQGLKIAIRDFGLAAHYERNVAAEDRGLTGLIELLGDLLADFLGSEDGELRGLAMAVKGGDQPALKPALDKLRARFSCPIQIDRRASLAACGEWLIGRQREPEGLVWLGLEPNEGGWQAETGVVLDGRLRAGSAGTDVALPATGGDIGDVLRLVAGLLDPELIVVAGGPADLGETMTDRVARPGFGAFAVAEGGVALAFEEALEQLG